MRNKRKAPTQCYAIMETKHLAGKLILRNLRRFNESKNRLLKYAVEKSVCMTHAQRDKPNENLMDMQMANRMVTNLTASGDGRLLDEDTL